MSSNNCDVEKFVEKSARFFNKSGLSITPEEAENNLEGRIINQLLYQIDSNDIPDSKFKIKIGKEYDSFFVGIVFKNEKTMNYHNNKLNHVF